MARLMGNADFRNDQWERRFDPHIAPINRYVDEIRTQGLGWAPYVAPLHGGVDARVLSILRDPGPATLDGAAGSGFLCVENDDASAELQCAQLAQAGLTPADLLPWNAYPWYVNRQPSAGELSLGVATIVHLLELAPKITVVLLQGGAAHKSWKLMRQRHPDLVRRRKLTEITSYHPGRQALFSPDPKERARRAARRFEAFHEIAAALSDGGDASARGREVT